MDEQKKLRKIRLTQTTNVKRPKSNLKKMGHKATYLLGNALIITSAAKDAVSTYDSIKSIDKKNVINSHKGSHVELLSSINGTKIGGEQELLEASVSRENITISGGIYNFNKKIKEKKTVQTKNPAVQYSTKTMCGNVAKKTDYLGIKPVLEKKFFGQTYNDNVRVQIAYNILDIKKILASTINNIVSMFYNLNRYAKDNDADINQETDIIGMIKTYQTYEEAKQDIGQKQLLDKVESLLKKTSAFNTYFDRLFTTPSKQAIKAGALIDNKKKDNSNRPSRFDELSTEQQKKYINEAFSINYDVLRLIGIGRQIVVHDKHRSDSQGNKADAIEALFDIEEELNNDKSTDLLNRLNSIYKGSVRQIDQPFKASAATNCYILEQLYKRIGKPMTQSQVYNDYYRYAILKDNMCLGISFNALKEAVIERYKSEHRSNDLEYSNDNRRFFVLCNFVLWRYLASLKDQSYVADIMRDVRACCDSKGVSAEEQKKTIYKNFVDLCWDDIKTPIDELYKLCVQNRYTNKNYKISKDIVCYNSLTNSASQIKPFVKYIYFLSEFLDGKEVNVFFNALINKFENIAEIITTINDSVKEYTGSTAGIVMSSKYALFNDAYEVANQLRIARNVKDATIRARINDKVSDIDSRMAPSVQTITDAVHMLIDENDSIDNYKRLIWDENENGRLVHKQEKNNKARNFIINNVIMSKWFMYISKYCDPRNCAKIMHNREIVSFTMSSIPDAQIVKYYNRIFSKKIKEHECDAEKRDAIIDKLISFSLRTVLTGVANGVCSVNNREEAIGIIQLYLTVAYIITKSLVDVNKRFLLAFSCLERDFSFIVDAVYNNRRSNILALSEKYIDEDIAIEQRYRLEKMNRITDDMTQEEKNVVYKEINAKYKTKHYAESITRQRDSSNSKDKSCAYLVTNLQEAKGIEPILAQYKNFVDHLNVIKQAPNYFDGIKGVNSFYGIYCYVLQNMLADKMIEWGNNDKNKTEDIYRINSIGKKLKRNLNEHHTFSSDFMWIINMPFAYNFPRYKNLSSEYLFYSMEYNTDKDE